TSLLLDRGSGMRQGVFGMNQMAGGAAGGVGLGERCARIRKTTDEPYGNPSHSSPPARSALGDFRRDPRPSTDSYHLINHAVAIIAAIPNTLIKICVAMPPDSSTTTKWPAKARNTPRQKISRECWPHWIAGRKTGHLSAGQPRGTNRTVSTASARKWANRRTSRLVLSIGYMNSASHRGTK